MWLFILALATLQSAPQWTVFSLSFIPVISSTHNPELRVYCILYYIQQRHTPACPIFVACRFAGVFICITHFNLTPVCDCIVQSCDTIILTKSVQKQTDRQTDAPSVA